MPSATLKLRASKAYSVIGRCLDSVEREGMPDGKWTPLDDSIVRELVLEKARLGYEVPSR